ncbi:LysR family transcriptional regulator [Pseudomonas corrugata]|uniref:LysR family transcriptional regulator n=1 Tax=Pseudomonas corrugata TaxID=47879 RepID=UPI00223279C0|nr:LysR family transcriptional regulator [Pseudomonas corrugata]UZD97711.1 LysR family transcriptional regulator [Pseudomonas corrugata]
MNALTLDQFAVFVAVVDEGSFAAAARRMNRAQSAITYAIQKLEEQSSLSLFDRSAYRPVLTKAGEALLPRARRILEDLTEWRLMSRSMSSGVEAQISLILVSYTPASLLSKVLCDFRVAYPFVELSLFTEPFNTATQFLRDGRADLGLLIEHEPFAAEFERNRCGWIDLVAVASPAHPLAQLASQFDASRLKEYTQIVLSNLPDLGKDYGVHAANRWRVTDLHTKRDLILAGIGWGSMPRSRIEDDLEAGRLQELKPDRWQGADRMPGFPLVVAHRKETLLGPAGRWLFERFANDYSDS